MSAPTFGDDTWQRIANCDHAAFNALDTPQQPMEECPSCGAILRTITTAEGWADHWAEQRADERAYHYGRSHR